MWWMQFDIEMLNHQLPRRGNSAPQRDLRYLPLQELLNWSYDDRIRLDFDSVPVCSAAWAFLSFHFCPRLEADSLSSFRVCRDVDARPADAVLDAFFDWIFLLSSMTTFWYTINNRSYFNENNFVQSKQLERLLYSFCSSGQINTHIHNIVDGIRCVFIAQVRLKLHNTEWQLLTHVRGGPCV